MSQATLPKRSNELLRPDASYMLVGGLGGIGRATALWMANHGARNLIFVNRSGMSNPASRATVQALKDKGINALIHACNVSDQGQFQGMLSQLKQTIPPVRGVIQAAMVLRVCTFPPALDLQLTKLGHPHRKNDCRRLQCCSSTKIRSNLESTPLSPLRSGLFPYVILY